MMGNISQGSIAMVSNTMSGDSQQSKKQPLHATRGCLTKWRISMDEIEFLRLRNKAYDAITHDKPGALMMLLHLIDALEERVTEMQDAEGDDE